MAGARGVWNVAAMADKHSSINTYMHNLPLAFVLAGHVTDMAGARGVWNVAAMAEKYGPLFKLQLMGSVLVVLSDPQTISRVARKTGAHPRIPFALLRARVLGICSMQLPHAAGFTSSWCFLQPYHADISSLSCCICQPAILSPH